MRIIGGKHQRRILNPPAGLAVRPTTDKAKEALFNVLNNLVDFDGLRVLDLFAGTGNISFEFASRGARKVVAVEKSFKCVRYIKSVKEQLDLTVLDCQRRDVLSFISQCQDSFDLVFADPPYELRGLAELPAQILAGNLLDKDALFILEHPGSHNFQGLPGFFREKGYSRVHFSFFRKTGA